MTKEQTEKAGRIIAACERMLLEVIPKTLKGPWRQKRNPSHGTRTDVMAGDIWVADTGTCETEGMDTFGPPHAAFIAQARTMSEPALRSTVIAINALLAVARNCDEWSDVRHGSEHAITAILDAWPEDVLK